MRKNKIEGLLLGAIIGDVLGVPYEFSSKEQMKKTPCTDFSIGGVHDQPLYSWSDDTSMSLALMNSITKNNFIYNTEKTKKEYLNWIKKGEYTFNGNVFDYGIQTRAGLFSVTKLENDEEAMGNGVLMRVHVLACLKYYQLKDEVFLTHPSYKNLYYCNEYLFILKDLINGDITRAKNFLLNNKIEYSAKGYMVDSLLLGLECLLTTNTFKDCVLKAINYGGDTDTNGSIAGALAGAFYGVSGIQQELKKCLQHNLIKKIVYDFINGVKNEN